MAWDWLPDNRHLLTQVPTTQLQMQLSRVDVETGASEVVFRSFGGVPQLSVSPDGRRLAMTRGEIGWHVYQVSIASGATRPFLSGSGVVSWMADWSPTGTRYLVATNRSGAFAIEDVSALDGFSRRLVVAGPQQNLVFPRWSPDGSRIAYVDHSKEARFMVANVAGGRPTAFGPTMA